MIDEIQIVPVQPKNGLVAFASFTFQKAIRCTSVAVYTRPNGGLRLVYPTKNVGRRDFDVFYPINREVGKVIEEEVTKKYEDVMKETHDRHGCISI
ncbi:septation protein SpoVG family protein [Candidatus Saccharibacteria bacterium]|nr:septation protein SpoVG family protein [Candidatus Saccharibacteria bacterium]